MNSRNPLGAAELTAAPTTETSPGAPGDGALADFSATRRSPVRRYFQHHPRIMDAVVVLCYLVLNIGGFIESAIAGEPLHAALLVAAAAALVFRRDRPLAVVGFLCLVEIGIMVVGASTSNIGSSLWFGLYAVAVRYRPVPSFTAAGVVSVPVIAYLLLFYHYPEEFLIADGPTAEQGNLITAVVLLLSIVLATGIGYSVRRARDHELELRSWAVRNAQLASVAERNRIAREMHDVVAHSLTVMVALSDGAAVVVRRSPEQAADVLDRLSETGRTALADMRRVLGVLRDERPAEDGQRVPMPDRADLGALVEGFRHAGLPLAVTHAGPPLPADPALQLTVYRIVQESLTNVLRYGTAVSRVQVRIENDDGGRLRIQVADDGHGSVNTSIGTGQGIAGMRERAGIYAGTVTAGPGPGGGWLVEAVLHPRTTG